MKKRKRIEKERNGGICGLFLAIINHCMEAACTRKFNLAHTAYMQWNDIAAKTKAAGFGWRSLASRTRKYMERYS